MCVCVCVCVYVCDGSNSINSLRSRNWVSGEPRFKELCPLCLSTEHDEPHTHAAAATHDKQSILAKLISFFFFFFVCRDFWSAHLDAHHSAQATVGRTICLRFYVFFKFLIADWNLVRKDVQTASNPSKCKTFLGEK